MNCRKCGLEIRLNWHKGEGPRVDHIFPKDRFRNLDEVTEFLSKHHAEWGLRVGDKWDRVA